MKTSYRKEMESDRLKLQDLHQYSSKDLYIQSTSTKDGKEKCKIFYEITWKEIIFYAILYWGSLIYSLYSFYKFSQIWKHSLHLTKKRSIYGLYQDQNDMEWSIFSSIIVNYIPYGVLHFLISYIIRSYIPQVLCLFYISFSLIILIKLIGYLGISLCIFVPTIMFVALYTRWKVMVWLTWCSILILFNTQKFLDMLFSDNQENEYKISVIVAWIILRSLSFCLDTCDDDPLKNKSSASLFITLIAYCLYFPLLITGPYMPYTDFDEGLKKPFEAINLKKCFWIIGQYVRYLFWFYLTDSLLYFFYAHSLVYSPVYAKHMDSWQLAGFVYFLLTFFLLKYVVYYGLPAIIARAEGYEPPRHPRCVLHIYKISDVWRYFDHGLYRFMIKHIYLYFIRDDRTVMRQLQGSVIVFTFIYIWHGVTPGVFWWSTFNFLGVVLEKMAYSIAKSKKYLDFEDKWLSGARSRRFTAMLASWSLLLSVCSLVIFLSSIENADTLLKRIFIKGFPNTTVTTLFLFYCLAQLSIELENVRKKRKSQQTN